MRPSRARPAWRGRRAAHRRNRRRRRPGRLGALPDLRRSLRAPAAARRSHHARRKTGSYKTVVGLRRQHSRDQRSPQTHLPDQGRPTGTPGLSRAGPLAIALRRGRRRSRRHRLRPHRAGRLYARARNVVIGSNRLAVDAAAMRARQLGFRTLVLSTFVEGETREIARMHAAIAKEIVHAGRPLKPPACVITGGETTVTLRGDGLGGRNQEFVLSAAMDIAGLENVVVLSAGTDGSDGPTEAAGAIADGRTLTRNPRAPEFLARNDSYRYFEGLGDLIVTGPTNTNVMDVRLILVGEQP